MSFNDFIMPTKNSTSAAITSSWAPYFWECNTNQEQQINNDFPRICEILVKPPNKSTIIAQIIVPNVPNIL
jgi:hypothetical protein